MRAMYTSDVGCMYQDAYILGRLLADRRTTLANVESALKVYESVRLPAASAVVERARITGLMYEFDGPGYYDGSMEDLQKEKAALEELGAQLKEQWSWQWKSSFEVDWKEALNKYEKDCLGAVNGAHRMSWFKCFIQ